MPSTQRSRAALRSFTEMTCMKSRGRRAPRLDDVQAALAGERARVHRRHVVFVRDSAPASTALPITFS